MRWARSSEAPRGTAMMLRARGLSTAGSGADVRIAVRMMPHPISHPRVAVGCTLRAPVRYGNAKSTSGIKTHFKESFRYDDKSVDCILQYNSPLGALSPA